MPLLLTGASNSYVYGPGGVPIEQIAADTATYLHADQLGSIRLLTAADGTVAGTASYSANGVRAAGGAASTPFGFAGQYTDGETGLIYLRTRYYDPTTGAFLTVDPAVTSTRSGYGYANGNRSTGGDPTGLCAFWCKVAIGAAIGVLAAATIGRWPGSCGGDARGWPAQRGEVEGQRAEDGDGMQAADVVAAMTTVVGLVGGRDFAPGKLFELSVQAGLVLLYGEQVGGVPVVDQPAGVLALGRNASAVTTAPLRSRPANSGVTG